MNIFRIKINPSGGDASKEDTFQYCLDNKLLGVGWRLPGEELTATKNFDVYEEKYGKVPQVRYIKNNVKKGDLVWTRGVGNKHSGKHFIARVSSEWEYWNPKEVSKHDTDIVNIFRCDSIREVEADQVPGKVKSSFNGRGNTIQRVTGKNILEESKCLWNSLSRKNVYTINKSGINLFDMLTAEEAEDILFLYLQEKGWRVIPNSRKGSTMKYEFLVKHPNTGELAKTQVKVGKTKLNRAEYKSGRWFLWQLHGIYTGAEADNVTCISRDAIKEFIKSSQKWLPKWLTLKEKNFGL